MQIKALNIEISYRKPENDRTEYLIGLKKASISLDFLQIMRNNKFTLLDLGQTPNLTHHSFPELKPYLILLHHKRHFR